MKQPYILAVRSNTSVSVAAKGTLWPVTVGQVASAIKEEGWQRLSAGDGAKGPRLYDWALVPLTWIAEEGWTHWLLVRRDLEDPKELAYYLVFAPIGTLLTEIVRAAGLRWWIEESIERAKGEAGLDEHEVRHWEGWYRHITLSLLAHAFLVVTRAQAAAALPEKGGARAA